MSDKPWKQFERDCAAHFGCTRFPANMGGRVDAESETVVIQCKNVKSMSLAALTALVDDITHIGKVRGKSGVVCIKLRAGSGKPTTTLLVQAMSHSKSLGQMDTG